MCVPMSAWWVSGFLAQLRGLHPQAPTYRQVSGRGSLLPGGGGWVDTPGGRGQEKGRKLGLYHAFALQGWRVLGGSEWLAEPACLPLPLPQLTCPLCPPPPTHLPGVALISVPCSVEGGAICGPREEVHPRAKGIKVSPSNCPSLAPGSQ